MNFATVESPTTTKEPAMLDLYAPPIGPEHAHALDDERSAAPVTCGSTSPLHPSMQLPLACTLLTPHGPFHAHHLEDGTQLARWGNAEGTTTDKVRVWTPAGAIVIGPHHRWLPIDSPATPAQIGALR